MFICLNIANYFYMIFINRNIAALVIFTISFSLIGQSQNVAKDAKISASSILNEETSADNVVDGIIGVDGLGNGCVKGFVQVGAILNYPGYK